MVQTEVQPATTNKRVGRVADPYVMVIFGYSGDLTRRKLIPALYNLASQQLLSKEFAVIGVGRTPMSDEHARKKITEDFKQFATGPIDTRISHSFVSRVSYHSETGLTHRSLAWKRNSPGHFGAACREWSFRSHVESPLHRPRTDFCWRNRWC